MVKKTGWSQRMEYRSFVRVHTCRLCRVHVYLSWIQRGKQEQISVAWNCWLSKCKWGKKVRYRFDDSFWCRCQQWICLRAHNSHSNKIYRWALNRASKQHDYIHMYSVGREWKRENEKAQKPEFFYAFCRLCRLCRCANLSISQEAIVITDTQQHSLWKNTSAWWIYTSAYIIIIDNCIILYRNLGTLDSSTAFVIRYFASIFFLSDCFLWKCQSVFYHAKMCIDPKMYSNI